jgi:hypothetical protein
MNADAPGASQEFYRSITARQQLPLLQKRQLAYLERAAKCIALLNITALQSGLEPLHALR